MKSDIYNEMKEKRRNKTMKYLTTKEFAERVGVQQQTVINWSNKGVFKEHHKTPGGHRCYTEEQVEQFLNGDTTEQQGKQ